MIPHIQPFIPYEVEPGHVTDLIRNYHSIYSLHDCFLVDTPTFESFRSFLVHSVYLFSDLETLGDGVLEYLYELAFCYHLSLH